MMLLTEEQEKLAKELYTSNVSVREISDALSIPERDVYSFFSTSNLPSLRKVAAKQIQDTIYRLYTTGEKKSYSDISAIVGRSKSHVCRIIKKYMSGEEQLSPETGVVFKTTKKTKQAKLKEKPQCCMCNQLQNKVIGLKFSDFFLCSECLIAIVRYPQRDWSDYISDDMLKEIEDDPRSLKAVEYLEALKSTE